MIRLSRPAQKSSGAWPDAEQVDDFIGTESNAGGQSGGRQDAGFQRERAKNHGRSPFSPLTSAPEARTIRACGANPRWR